MEERYCAHCGSRCEGATCCWYLEGEEERAHPHRLIPGRSWAEWSSRQRFLIALLMERFGGAAEEWELFCRLPWPQRWLLDCATEAWSGWPEPARMFPCLREKDARGIRYFVTDMARDAFTTHRRAEAAAAAANHRERLGAR